MVDKNLLDINCAWTQLLLSFSSKFLFTIDLCTNSEVTCSPCAVFHGNSFCPVNGVEVTPELQEYPFSRSKSYCAFSMCSVSRLRCLRGEYPVRRFSVMTHTVIIAQTLVTTIACALSGSVLWDVGRISYVET